MGERLRRIRVLLVADSDEVCALGKSISLIVATDGASSYVKLNFSGNVRAIFTVGPKLNFNGHTRLCGVPVSPARYRAKFCGLRWQVILRDAIYGNPSTFPMLVMEALYSEHFNLDAPAVVIRDVQGGSANEARRKTYIGNLIRLDTHLWRCLSFEESIFFSHEPKLAPKDNNRHASRGCGDPTTKRSNPLPSAIQLIRLAKCATNECVVDQPVGEITGQSTSNKNQYTPNGRRNLVGHVCSLASFAGNTTTTRSLSTSFVRAAA